ncbi:MAG: hypothetical protein U0441_13685 [Polyangiaceae bacterium]
MSEPNDPAPNPYQKPVFASDPEPSPQYKPHDPKVATFAQRLGGGLMAMNGVLLLCEMALLPPQKSGSPVSGIGPAIVDIILGLVLLRGSASVLVWAIVRAALGMTAGAALRASEGPVVVVYTVLLCASILGLLIGKADRIRTAVAGSVLGLCVAVEMVSLIGLSLGNNPLASLLMTASGDVEGSPVHEAQGRTAPYQLAFPNDRWYLRKQESAAKDNADADRWFMRPDKDAHILVIAEHVPGKTLAVDAYADAIAQNMQREVPNLSIDAREPWAPNPTHGRVLRMHGRRDNIDFTWYCVAFTAIERGYYMLAFGTQDTMRDLDAEIRSITDSFRVPKEVLDALPPDVDPTPVTTVRGQKIPYAITAPERWFLRKEDVVKAENSALDKWLIRPELDAHVFVIAEEVPAGLTLPLDKYVAVVLENAHQGTENYTEVSREKWAKFPNDGVRVHASMTRSGVDMEYEYALYAKANRAYQVTGFTTKTSYATAKADIVRAIDSFEPAP